MLTEMVGLSRLAAILESSEDRSNERLYGAAVQWAVETLGFSSTADNVASSLGAGRPVVFAGVSIALNLNDNNPFCVNQQTKAQATLPALGLVVVPAPSIAHSVLARFSLLLLDLPELLAPLFQTALADPPKRESTLQESSTHRSEPVTATADQSPLVNPNSRPDRNPLIQPPTHDPLRVGPVRMPGQQNPFAIGQGDLDPFGPRFGDPAGGMLVGPHHPIWNQQQPRRAGPGMMPPRFPGPNVPPGARFDPAGPTLRTMYGEPDNDEFKPPGYDNMYL